jgi:hypothetical protein
MLRLFWMSAIVALLAAASPALADSPAAIDKSAPGAEASFKKFAKDFMARHYQSEAQAKKSPTVARGTNQVTYRGYDDDWTVELRPTGHPSAPYVGLLRYTEHTYSCTDMSAKKCRIASSTPVTEIFRYQKGGWGY